MRYKIYGMLFSVFLFLAFFYLTSGLPVFVSSSSLGEELWDARFFDTFLQAFVLLVTVMGVIYLEEEWPWI